MTTETDKTEPETEKRSRATFNIRKGCKVYGAAMGPAHAIFDPPLQFDGNGQLVKDGEAWKCMEALR